MDPSDIAGHIGYLFIFLGMYLLTVKSAYGWLARIVGELIWCVIGIHLGMTSLWIWGIIFMMMDIRGWLLWRKSNGN